MFVELERNFAQKAIVAMMVVAATAAVVTVIVTLS